MTPLSYSYEDTLPDRTGILFTWDILSLKRRRIYDGHNDLVAEVEWSLTVSESTAAYQETGTVQLNIESVSNPIDYYSLTKEQVLEWVKTRLNEIHYIENHPDDYITRFENMIIQNLRSGSVKDTIGNFPWS